MQLVDGASCGRESERADGLLKARRVAPQSRVESDGQALDGKVEPPGVTAVGDRQAQRAQVVERALQG